MSRWMCSMSSPTARSRSIFWAAMRGSISKPTRSETWLWYCASKNPPIQSATFNSILKVEHAQHEETMTHSTLQRIFSVLNYKSRCEKVSGSMSSLVCQQFDNDVNEDIITFNMFKPGAGELEARKPFVKGMLSSTGLPLMTTKRLHQKMCSTFINLMVVIV